MDRRPETVSRRERGAVEPRPPTLTTERPAAPLAEPRQRWRLTFSREPVRSERVGRVALDAWNEALAASGLPLAGLDGPDGRARLAIAAPLPAEARGERELADIWLFERVPAWRVREALASSMPEAHGLVDAEDVWLGAPALAGRVVAADWRIEVAGPGEDGDDDRGPRTERLAAAASLLTDSPTIPRLRFKGTTEKRYDLRPLLISVDVEGGPDGARPTIIARTRFDPELGAGRPDEVLAALSEAAGLPLAAATTTRKRLFLADDAP